MKKKVIVACGGAVATSTIAANKVVELCKKTGSTWRSARSRSRRSNPTFPGRF